MSMVKKYKNPIDTTSINLKFNNTNRCEVVSDKDGELMDIIELRKPTSWGERYMKDKLNSNRTFIIT